VLHFLAIAKAAGVKWDIDDFERVARRTPVICDLKPSGRFVAVDFHRAGGVPQVMKILLDHDRIDGDCLTVTGRTVAEELADVPSQPRGDQAVILPWERALYDRGHLSILKGNLSLVGPRPHAINAKAEARLYDEAVDGYFARHRVKPGITGWAQINGWRGETDTHEKIQKRVEHDLHYIENWSVLFDLYIAARTPFALMKTENAY